MSQVSRCVSVDKATAQRLAMVITALPEAYWLSAEKGTVNYALDGSVGRYARLSDRAMPVVLRDDLVAQAPVIADLSLDEIVVNRYLIGDYIPPHRDSNDCLACCVLVLTETAGDGVYFECADGSTQFVQDMAGLVYRLDELKVKHWVEPVQAQRFSVIYLYK